MTEPILSSQSIDTFDTFFLRPGMLDDLPEAVAMFNTCSRETRGRDEFELEDYRNEWSDSSFAELRRRRRTRVGLGVDAGSLTGATRLYEKAGMRAIRDFIKFEKQLRAGVDLAIQTIEQ